MHRIWISPVPAFKRLFRPSKPFRVLYTRLWWTWATVHFERWYLLKQLVDCCFLFKVPGPRFQTPFSPFKTISRLIHGLCWTWATKFISKNIFARTPFLSPPVPAFKRLFCSSKPFCDLYTSLSAEPWQQNSCGEMIRAIKQHSDCCLLKNDTPSPRVSFLKYWK